MPNQLARFYLNNEAWLYDGTRRLFTHEGDGTRKLTEEDVQLQGIHIASLMIVCVKGKAWYYDDRLQELRRVGEPTMVLTFEQFNLLSEPERALSIPKGPSFKRAMEKEAAYRAQRLRLNDADADSVRG